MIDYKGFSLQGHLWLPCNSKVPDWQYQQQIEDFFGRLRITMQAKAATSLSSAGPTLDKRLDAYTPPWLMPDQMWASHFLGRAQTPTETLLYERLLRSHYAERYSSNSVRK